MSYESLLLAAVERGAGLREIADVGKAAARTAVVAGEPLIRSLDLVLAELANPPERTRVTQRDTDGLIQSTAKLTLSLPQRVAMLQGYAEGLAEAIEAARRAGVKFS